MADALALSGYYPMPEAVRLIPRAVAERLRLLPLAITPDGRLSVAMSDPQDLPALDEVRALTGCSLKVCVFPLEDIRDNFERIYNFHEDLERAVADVQRASGEEPGNVGLDAADVDKAPLVRLLDGLLREAVRENASDVHIEAQEDGTRVRFRVDGRLSTPLKYPKTLHAPLISRIKIISGLDITERRRPQDGRVFLPVDGKDIDLRVSTLPTLHGEKAVLRILEREEGGVRLEDLGFEAEDLRTIERFCAMPWGILLATGPTGSGKSTTLYAMLQKMNRPDLNIVTVEDPIEFSIPGINQVQVNEILGFDNALRSILRQDPDKIMVGEIRDQETAQISMRAALTGHFVLSTLHTNTAPGAVARMVDMGVPPFLVSASLSGVIAQRLVRRLCPACREEYEIDAYTCRTIGVPPGTRAFRARGCRACRGGYRGRRGIYEIMVVDDDLRKVILSNASPLDLRNAAVEKGMRTLRQAGIRAALSGSTSLEEVLGATL